MYVFQINRQPPCSVNEMEFDENLSGFDIIQIETNNDKPFEMCSIVTDDGV